MPPVAFREDHMNRRITAFSHPSLQITDRTCTMQLMAIVVLAIAIRIIAAFVLKHPLESDPLAYFTMAQGLAERGELLDMWGQHAFYSAGYPLRLTPFRSEERRGGKECVSTGRFGGSTRH